MWVVAWGFTPPLLLLLPSTTPQVKIPADHKQRFIIDSTALYVLKDGCEFEQLIMMEQQGQPEFNFLFELDSPEHAYYRWRLYSLSGVVLLRTCGCLQQR